MYRTTGPNGGNVRAWDFPPDGRPATVAVDGHVWGFIPSVDGNVHYAGEYYNQELIIRPPNGRNGTSQVSLQMGLVLGVPVGYDGVFYNGGFTMNGGSPPVTAGNDNGLLVNPTDGLGRYQNVVADLDITGNILTLGSWAGDSTLSHAGMALQYSETFTLPGVQPLPAPGRALIYMTGSRPDTSFLWNHAPATTGANVPMMLLAGADHSLRLFAPSDPANAAITLNPSGQSYLLNFGPYPDTANDTATGTDKTKGILVIGAGSKVGATVTPRNAMRITDDGVMLIQESGDIPMGEFANGPRP